MASIAISSGYTQSVMNVSIAEAKNRLPELIRAVENGQKVVITRHGKPVGWENSVNLDRFLAGDV
jgi:Antitoxin Phd_YefM, type II toxin-antitoxin system